MAPSAPPRQESTWRWSSWQQCRVRSLARRLQEAAGGCQEPGQEAAPEVAQVVGLQGGEEIVLGTVVAAAGEVQTAHIGDLDTSVSHRPLAK